VGWESVAQRLGWEGIEACPPRHGRAGATADARVASRPICYQCCRAGRIAGCRFRVSLEPRTQSAAFVASAAMLGAACRRAGWEWQAKCSW
jgi:hypothetical protein